MDCIKLQKKLQTDVVDDITNKRNGSKVLTTNYFIYIKSSIDNYFNTIKIN